jgi:hypothetical protein
VLHVGARTRCADPGRDQSAPEDLLLPQVVQAGESHPGGQRAQRRQQAADRVRPADRHDHDPLRLEIPAEARGGRLQRDLVADALDEHHRPGVVDLRQGAGRRLGRRVRATHVAIERPAGQLTALGDIHGVSRLPACAPSVRPRRSTTDRLATAATAGRAVCVTIDVVA